MISFSFPPYNCNFAAIMNHSVNIARGRVCQGAWPEPENGCLRGLCLCHKMSCTVS